MKKCPTSIWHWDSNPQPLKHESPLITTRPGLPPNQAIVTFEADGTCARVVGEGAEGASSSVGTGVVIARIVWVWNLAEGFLVAYGTGTFEGWASGHADGAGASVLAFEAASAARVLVLAILADVVGRASEIKIKMILVGNIGIKNFS